MANIKVTLSFLILIGLHNFIDAQVISNESTPLLDNIYNRYQKAKSIKANFDLIIQLPEDDEEIQNGMMIQKGDKYIVELKDYKVYNDGDNQWIHLYSANEVQWTEAANAEEDAIPNLRDIISLYKSDAFKYVRTPNKDLLSSEVQIDFTPIDKDAEYFKVRLIVNTEKMEPKSMKFFHKDGSRYTLYIRDIRYDVDIKDSAFRFDVSAHPQVHVEDLRID